MISFLAWVGDAPDTMSVPFYDCGGILFFNISRAEYMKTHLHQEASL
jgi:hypothetical protein